MPSNSEKNYPKPIVWIHFYTQLNIGKEMTSEKQIAARFFSSKLSNTRVGIKTKQEL